MVENGFLKYVLPRFSLKTQIRISRSSSTDPATVPEGGYPDPAGSAWWPRPSGEGAARIVRVPLPMTTETYAAVRLAASGTTRACRPPCGLAAIGGGAQYADQPSPIDGRGGLSTAGRRTGAGGEGGGAGRSAGGREAGLFPLRPMPCGGRTQSDGRASAPRRPLARSGRSRIGRIGCWFSIRSIPHPSFTQVEGVTPPFDPARPPHIAPVELTIDDVEAIAAFARTIPPKDLGGVTLEQ